MFQKTETFMNDGKLKINYIKRYKLKKILKSYTYMHFALFYKSWHSICFFNTQDF